MPETDALADKTSETINRLGIQLPALGPSAGSYVHARMIGDIVYLAGKGPIMPNGDIAVGRIGIEFSTEEAYAHARLSGLWLISALSDVLNAELDRVVAIGKVLGMLRTAPDFTGHPGVLDGCSDLLIEVFGERGRHARSAVGVATLPFGIPIEIEMTAHIR